MKPLDNGEWKMNRFSNISCKVDQFMGAEYNQQKEVRRPV